MSAGPAEICRIAERAEAALMAVRKATEEFVVASGNGDWQRAEDARQQALNFHESWFDQITLMYHAKPGNGK